MTLDVSLPADASGATASPGTDALHLRAKLFRGLGDPNRLAILAELDPDPRTVGEIVSATGLTQPNASNHLRCLSECGLVLREAKGRHALYRLADPRVPGLLRDADALLAAVATGVPGCSRYAEGGPEKR
ncbi:metalloregulator ArsR/SmtB family transcription factor [uncultured Jannaschia sp.]|uniref:ArsR/SmtB family transcription factor n=1 Tax=uncultured Jannaschia sp. TaxID=293347 RepID=UPI002621C198|nr:metalloregulator ArsR/SmtB family transcription factor [uncultured Jannaschia sp.]